MDLRGRTILLTGGAGFIGSHLADALGDCRLRIVDGFSTGREANLARRVALGNVEITRGDLRDASLLPELLDGVDVVFHLACRGVRHSIGHPLDNHAVNATATLQLCLRPLAAPACNASSTFRRPRSTARPARYRWTVPPTFPETVDGASKLAGECYARACYQTHGFPTVVVRPFNNFGLRSHHEGDSGEVIPRFVVWLNGSAATSATASKRATSFTSKRPRPGCSRRPNATPSARPSTSFRSRDVDPGAGGPGLRCRGRPPMHARVSSAAARRRAAARGRRDQRRGPCWTRCAIGLREGIEKLVAHLRESGNVEGLLSQTQTINW